MEYYRFMPSRYIDGVLAGSVRLGRLVYYRLLEEAWEDQWIGDREEGLARTYVDGVLVDSTSASDVMREKIKKIGIHAGRGTVQINEMQVVQEIDGFILCFACGEFNDVKDNLWKDDYDGCVRYSDLRAFGEAIYQNGRTDKGEKISDLMHKPVWGDVEYLGNSVDIRSSNPLSASPFLKRPDYIGQSEYRVFFQPKKEIVGDFITVNVELPDGCVEEIFREHSSPIQSSKKEIISIVDPLKVLQSTYDLIQKFRRSGGDSAFPYELTMEERREIWSRESNELSRYFNEKLRRSAFLAYWKLREGGSGSSIKLDRYFSMFVSFRGGLMTAFIFALENYIRVVEERTRQLQKREVLK